jgi:uncharacterized cupin superfamily protein
MGKTNADDLDWTTTERGQTRFERKQLGEAAGGEQIGCSLYRIPPGRRSWPYHYHTANEEALFVLSGSGTLRLGTDEENPSSDQTGSDDIEETPLTDGGYVALPTGERGGHRVVNDGDEPLTYLMVSTMREPDVAVYPDSEKFGVFVGSPPGGSGERSLDGYYRIDDDVDYWEGEERQADAPTNTDESE